MCCCIVLTLAFETLRSLSLLLPNKAPRSFDPTRSCVQCSSSPPLLLPRTPPYRSERSVEGRWPVGEEEAAALDDAVGKGEAEVGGEELLDVGAADVGGLLDLGDAEDLPGARKKVSPGLAPQPPPSLVGRT